MLTHGRVSLIVAGDGRREPTAIVGYDADRRSFFAGVGEYVAGRGVVEVFSVGDLLQVRVPSIADLLDAVGDAPLPWCDVLGEALLLPAVYGPLEAAAGHSQSDGRPRGQNLGHSPGTSPMN